jgi:hypothetical protein
MFKGFKGIKYNKDTKNLFHPKIYLFKKDLEWMIIIGSCNLTRAAFSDNNEVVLMLESKTDKNKGMFEKAYKYILSFWPNACTFSDSELKDYKVAYFKSRKVISKFYKKIKYNSGKTFDAPIVDLTWKDFSKAVFSEQEPEGHTFEKRYKMISTIQKIFLNIKYMHKMKGTQRQAIAGLLPNKDGIDYRWFGSMRGNGEFWKQINRNNIRISKALDYIPLKGPVNEEQFNKFVNLFIKAIPNSRRPVATATRLLAMKRPDYFICIDKMNMKKLSKNFAIPKSIGLNRYWKEIADRIQDSKWWNEKNIKPGKEAKLFKYRAAFLDSLFYKYE